MTEITVGNGWYGIISEAVDDASRLPEEWMFEITSATRVDGALKIDAQYNSHDVPLDPNTPHPFRALQQIRAFARLRSLNTCEICSRSGRRRGEGTAARVRCDEHVDVAEGSSGLGHFLADFGDGLDMMQELHRAAKREDGDDQS